MSYFTIYLIVMLDNISIASGVLFWLPIIILIITGFVALIGDFLDEEQPMKLIKRIVKICLICSGLAFLPCTFIPNTKQMAIIYVTPKLINSVNESKIPEALIGLANAWIEELKPEKKDGAKGN